VTTIIGYQNNQIKKKPDSWNSCKLGQFPRFSFENKKMQEMFVKNTDKVHVYSEAYFYISIRLYSGRKMDLLLIEEIYGIFW